MSVDNIRCDGVEVANVTFVLKTIICRKDVNRNIHNYHVYILADESEGERSEPQISSKISWSV